MLIKGRVLRQARLRKHMSQDALARGICSQGTISLIEKRDQNVTEETVTQLCDRLELAPEKVMVRPIDAAGATITNALRAFMHEDVAGCQGLLAQLRDNELPDPSWRRRYYCLLGLEAYAVHHDLTQASLRFSQTLHDPQVREWDAYRVLAQLGVGYICYQRGALGEALFHLRAARKEIDQVYQQEKWGRELQLFVHLGLAEVYCAQGRWGDAHHAAADGLYLLKESQSLFLLERFILVRARAEAGAGKQQRAATDLHGALFIAQERQNTVMAERINATLADLTAAS
ncbi:helix-turn-helix transcriptional regulator [Schleiferilactobacillus shenzhenensis]|nr:helix-turn-helix transcriptional regulator [Schleiferilactobacillus shenzhenensis]